MRTITLEEHFASPGFLAGPGGPKFYGPTLHGSFNGQPNGPRFTEGQMAKWSAKNFKKMSENEVDAVVEFLAAQSGRTDVTPPDAALVAKGRKLFEDGGENDSWQACSQCHRMKVKGTELEFGAVTPAPELTGYASEEWLRQFLLNPGAKENYGERNCMPSYRDRVSEKDLDILLRWMRHRWYETPPRIIDENPAPTGKTTE